MKNPLQVYGPNLNGRDFAIGDLHGALPAFQNLLREIHFDPTKDRMFSVADLVDRGPNSLECLGLIREDWFHCVLSNHEQMMVEAFTGGPMGAYWFRNGGAWGLEAWQKFKNPSAGLSTVITDEEADLYDLVNMVDELPFMMTINHKSGKKFHMLHAELPSAVVGVTDEMLEDPETVRQLATRQSGDGDSFLWGRYVFMPYYRSNVTKEKMIKDAKYRDLDRFFDGRDGNTLSHIISGHTILTKPITMIGQTNIDTCAYGSCFDDAEPWCGLTCINLDDWTFWKATPTTFEQVEPVTVNREDLI